MKKLLKTESTESKTVDKTPSIKEKATDLIKRNGGAVSAIAAVAMLSANSDFAVFASDIDVAKVITWVAWMIGLAFAIGGIINIISGARAYGKGAEEGNGNAEEKARGQIIGGIMALVAAAIAVVILPAIWNLFSSHVMIDSF